MSEDDGGKIGADVSEKTEQTNSVQDAAENEAKNKNNTFTTTGISEDGNVVQGYYVDDSKKDNRLEGKEYQTWYRDEGGDIKHHTFHNGEHLSKIEDDVEHKAINPREDSSKGTLEHNRYDWKNKSEDDSISQ